MTSDSPVSKEIFSFHLARVPALSLPQFLFAPLYEKLIPGLNHSENFFTMNLGEPVLSASRYNFKTLAIFAWWNQETSLDEFLDQPTYRFLTKGWHIRLKLYRRWGKINALRNVVIDPSLAVPNRPMVAVTLARLNILHTYRFAKFGKPVESQVRDHKSQILAFAALRPLNTFSTFSIWNSETEMINMVQGQNKLKDGESHKFAMQERNRQDFHHEFSTMRFTPIKEVGLWNGKSGYCQSQSFTGQA